MHLCGDSRCSNEIVLSSLQANEAGQGDIDAVLQAADGVLAAVDQEALARWLALQNPEEGPGAEKTKKQMEEQKAAVIAALHTKARVLIEDELSKVRSWRAAEGNLCLISKTPQGPPTPLSYGPDVDHMVMEPGQLLSMLSRGRVGPHSLFGCRSPETQRPAPAHRLQQVQWHFRTCGSGWTRLRLSTLFCMPSGRCSLADLLLHSGELSSLALNFLSCS